MRGLITAGGELTEEKIFLEEYKKSTLRIAADSGVEFYQRSKKVPDLVVGDFDSILQGGKAFIKDKSIPVFSFPKEKDYTDLELGIEYLIEQGCREITILGGIGNRIDHSLANLFMMIRYYREGVSIVLRNDLMKIQVLEGSMELEKDYEFISVVPANSKSITVTLKGFYYPLEKREMVLGSTLGVSNYLVEESGFIDIIKGTAFIIQTNE
ncbi:MAG: thiamine diphosphokinase [Gallicola sp.]|nr:thiamine diphosphokinase [Gallicola sp.]